MTKKDFELSFTLITDFLSSKNYIYNVLKVHDLSSIDFKRNDVDKVIIKMNLSGILWGGIFITNQDEPEIYYFEASRDSESSRFELKVDFTEKLMFVSQLEQTWEDKISKKFPNNL